MNNPTAGPWQLFKGWGADKRRPVIVDSIPDVDGKFVGNCICFLASSNPDVESNARLIAAAPDLLFACRAAMAVMQGKWTDAIEPGAPYGAAMNLMAAAIAKAEVAP